MDKGNKQKCHHSFKNDGIAIKLLLNYSSTGFSLPFCLAITSSAMLLGAGL
jgi:hypothetical protein